MSVSNAPRSTVSPASSAISSVRSIGKPYVSCSRKASAPPIPVEADAFAAAIDDALSRPEALASRLFTLRADQLLNGTAGAAARARLSGLLIGAELGAARDFWHNRSTIIIGAPALAALYETPLRAAGADARRLDGAELVLAGLTAAQLALQETS